MKKITTSILLLFIISSNAQVLEQYPLTQTLATPSNFINFNDKMFYFARNAAYQFSLYATDGTASGNQIVKSLGFAFGSNLSDKNKFNDFKIIFNNKLYFNFSNTFYQSDGTTAGTTVFTTSLQSPKHFIIYNNRLYFIAFSVGSGVEMWSTDGTVSGTTLVKDIFPGTSNAFNNQVYDPHFTVFNNKLFFVANDGVHGFELWSTDGTESGTSMFKDIRPTDGNDIYGTGAFLGSIYYNYPNFAVVGNKMYFGANPYSNDVSLGNFMVTDSPILYETDGTALNTKVVEPPLQDPNICNCGANTYNYIHSLRGLTVYNSKLFVYGRQAFHSFPGITNGGIYLVDGTNPITRLQALSGFGGDYGTSDETERYSMRLFNSEFYFIGETYDNTDELNLWKMNPIDYSFTKLTQATNTSLPDFSGSELLIARELNSKLFFVKTNIAAGQIFSTNGTVTGTQFEAKQTAPNKSESQFSTSAMAIIPYALGAFDNGLYFNGQFQFGGPSGLWRIINQNLSLSNFDSLTFSFYPNPVQNAINLKFKNQIANGYLKIISISGQTVLERQNLSGMDFNVDVAHLAKGLYIVQIFDGVQIANSKFIKE